MTEGRETSSDKTLAVMDLFTPDHPEWTVERASTALGQSESTVYRYFRSLAAAGLIISVRPGRYLLGPGIVHYDLQLRLSDPLLRAADPVFDRLEREFSGPGSLFVSRLYRDHIMVMHERWLGNLPFPERVFARGQLASLFEGAPAHALIAFFEVRTVRAMYQKAKPDEAGWPELKRVMRAVRARGFAVDSDFPEPGAFHLSVPLLHADGGVAGSMTIALPNLAVGPDQIERIGARMIQAAEELNFEAGRAAQD